MRTELFDSPMLIVSASLLSASLKLPAVLKCKDLCLPWQYFSGLCLDIWRIIFKIAKKLVNIPILKTIYMWLGEWRFICEQVVLNMVLLLLFRQCPTLPLPSLLVQKMGRFICSQRMVKGHPKKYLFSLLLLNLFVFLKIFTDLLITQKKEAKDESFTFERFTFPYKQQG